MMPWHGLAVAALALAVLLGAGFALAELSGRDIPLGAGLVHGVSALVAMSVMGVAIAAGPRSLLFNAALLVAAMTAVMGLLLFAFRFKREMPPAVIVLFHAVMGLVALGLALRALTGA